MAPGSVRVHTVCGLHSDTWKWIMPRRKQGSSQVQNGAVPAVANGVRIVPPAFFNEQCTSKVYIVSFPLCSTPKVRIKNV